MTPSLRTATDKMVSSTTVLKKYGSLFQPKNNRKGVYELGSD